MDRLLHKAHNFGYATAYFVWLHVLPKMPAVLRGPVKSLSTFALFTPFKLAFNLRRLMFKLGARRPV